MQLQVKGKNVEVTDSIRQYAEEKLGRLGRQLADPTRVELELAVEKNPSISANHVAEATIWTKGPVLRAREANVDMKASIDQLVDKLERQVKRYKEKRRRRRTGTIAAEHRANRIQHRRGQLAHRLDRGTPQILGARAVQADVDERVERVTRDLWRGRGDERAEHADRRHLKLQRGGDVLQRAASDWNRPRIASRLEHAEHARPRMNLRRLRVRVQQMFDRTRSDHREPGDRRLAPHIVCGAKRID